MLFDILRLIQQGAVHNSQELAHALNTSNALIQQMTQQLALQGYLISPQSTCAGGCSGCGHQKTCALLSSPRLWMLTEKGTAALKRTFAL